jgi:large subunit ribosomal protein L7A
VLEELKSGRKVVGIRQTAKALEEKSARLVFIAKDADEKTVAPLKDICEKMQIEVVYAESMKLLGKSCGIDVGAAVACLLKN